MRRWWEWSPAHFFQSCVDVQGTLKICAAYQRTRMSVGVQKLLYASSHTRLTFLRYLSFSAVCLKHHKNVKIYSPIHQSKHNGQTVSAVCLLVGWTGSRNKVIAKYSTIYTDLGIPCVALAPRIQDVWFANRGNELCEAGLVSLEELGNTTSTSTALPLIIHMFSGAGYSVFPKILESWSCSDSIFRTKVIPKCIVIDSGPADFSIKAGTEATKLVHKQGGFNLMTRMLTNTGGIFVSILIGNQKRALLRSALESDFLDIPQLYLHSKCDTVVPFERVREVMADQQERGRTVNSHWWENTDHLRLYVEHREEYTQQIHAFLKGNSILCTS